jgi:hypothetical protein
LPCQLGCGLLISLSHLVFLLSVATFLSQPTIRARVLTNQRVFNAAIRAVLILLGAALAVFDATQAMPG